MCEREWRADVPACSRPAVDNHVAHSSSKSTPNGNAAVRRKYRQYLLLLVVWSIAVLGTDMFIAGSIWRQVQASLRYQTVPGKVTFSDVKQSQGHKGSTRYRANVHYVYTVGRWTYNGDRYYYGYNGDSDHAAAVSIVQTYPVGSAPRVYYDPADPRDATLRVGVQPFQLFLGVVVVPVHMMTVLFWQAIVFRLRQGRFLRAARLISDNGHFAVLRLKTDTQLAGATLFAMISVGACALAKIFFFGTSLSSPIVAVMFATVMIAGTAGWFLDARARARGRFDLVIDNDRWFVTFPACFGGPHERTVPVESIVGVEAVHPTRSVASDEAKSSVLVSFVAASAREPVILAKELWPEDAAQLADWIRIRLGMTSEETWNTGSDDHDGHSLAA